MIAVNTVTRHGNLTVDDGLRVDKRKIYGCLINNYLGVDALNNI
jgi:hypothetical protein